MVAWKDVKLKEFECTHSNSGSYIYKAINTQRLETEPAEIIHSQCKRIQLAVHRVECSQAIVGYQIDVDLTQFSLVVVRPDFLLFGTSDLRPHTLKTLYEDKYMKVVTCTRNHLFLSKEL